MRYALVLLLAGCAQIERPTEKFSEVRTTYETITIEWSGTKKTTHPVRQIAWVKLPEKELQEVCKDSFYKYGTQYNGCYRFYKGVHLVITGEPISPNHLSLHCTLGHEVRHAFDGGFHGKEAVAMPCHIAYPGQATKKPAEAGLSEVLITHISPGRK